MQCTLFSPSSVTLTDQNQLLPYLLICTASPAETGATLPEHSGNWSSTVESAERLVGLSRKQASICI